MTQPIERDPIYRGRSFQTETMELCVRWYFTYRLSYRDLAAMMAERGVRGALESLTLTPHSQKGSFALTAIDHRGLFAEASL